MAEVGGRLSVVKAAVGEHLNEAKAEEVVLNCLLRGVEV